MSTTTPVDTLSERLERLESIEAARFALARYAEACDAQDLQAIAGLFGEDAELEIPGSIFKGRDEIVDFYARAWRDDPSVKSHFVTNISAHETERRRVEVTSYFLYTAAGDDSSVLGWGEYKDVVDTSGDSPLFSRKAISIRRAADVRQGSALERPEREG